MMKHTQTIFAKYCGRAYSTIASSPVSSSVKNAWKEEDGVVLSVVFLGGYLGHVCENLYKRVKRWYKVDKMYDDQFWRTMKLIDRSSAIRQALREEHKSKRP